MLAAARKPTRLPRRSLSDAARLPPAMAGAPRGWGNGGKRN
jgi:hypothetical protein